MGRRGGRGTSRRGDATLCGREIGDKPWWIATKVADRNCVFCVLAPLEEWDEVELAPDPDVPPELAPWCDEAQAALRGRSNRGAKGRLVREIAALATQTDPPPLPRLRPPIHRPHPLLPPPDLPHHPTAAVARYRPHRYTRPMARPAANSTETAPDPDDTERKIVGRPFEPGESGNPLGRPKGIARYVRERAGNNGELMIDFLISAMAGMMPKGGYNSLDAEGRPILVEISPAERITAAKILVERGFGKAPAFAPIEDDDPLDLQSEQALEDLAGRMDEKIDELAARRKRRAPAKPRRAATA